MNNTDFAQDNLTTIVEKNDKLAKLLHTVWNAMEIVAIYRTPHANYPKYINTGWLVEYK